MLNMKIASVSLGFWAAFTFFLSVADGLATPENFHMHAFLEQALPGFKWRSWASFIVGLVESFLYGVYAGLVYVPVYNVLRRRWGHDGKAPSFLLLACAVQRRRFPVGPSPNRRNAPAGSNRSNYGGNEMVEAFG